VRDLGYLTHLYGSLEDIYMSLLHTFMWLFCGQSGGAVACSVLVQYLGYVTHVTDLHGSLADTYRAFSRVFIQHFCGLL